MPDERRVAERRTLALRGPGAGGFTPAQSVAASNPCLNCGTNIQLEYCPECGQREIDPDPTLKEFLGELAEEFLRWDGKLATTFRTLVTRPGVLTAEFLAGRRVRYISPVRIYLTCSVLFFFLSAVAPDRRVSETITPRGVQSEAARRATLDSIGRANEHAPLTLGSFWATHYARAMRSPDALGNSMQSAMPKVMFVLVPLFAGIVALVYRDRRRRYPQHLVFALHLHAAFFLVLVAGLAGRFIPSVSIAGALQLLVLLPLFLVYFARAARTVYEGTAGEAAWRVTKISVVYFAVFGLALTALFTAAVLLA